MRVSPGNINEVTSARAMKNREEVVKNGATQLCGFSLFHLSIRNKLCSGESVAHGIMGRRFTDGGLLRYRK